MPLEEYYEDKARERYSNTLPAADPDILQAPAEFPPDIAKAVIFHIDQNSVSWTDASVAALENLTPRQWLKTPLLVKRLKTMLMHFP